MMKGWGSSQKLGDQKYVTMQSISGGKVAADMLPKAVYTEDTVNRVPEGGTYKSIRLTAHGISIGQMIRFVAGVNDGVELTVSSVTANEIFFEHKLSLAVTATDEFISLKYLTLTVDRSGNLQTSQGPLQFVKDSAVVQVIKDTANPANTTALPVEIVAVDGTEINITAGDINVQLSHTGANPDSTQLGDGTNILGITASNEALVKDADVLAELLLQKALLTSLDGKDFSTSAKQDSAKVTADAILAKIIAAPSTEAKQDTAITALGAILTDLELKADLTETQPVSLASSPLPTGASTEATLAAVLAKIIAAPSTEAKQDTAITSIDAITAKLIVAPATEAKQDVLEATLEAILAKIIVAPATEAKQDTSILSIDAITAKLIVAPATEAKQDTIITELTAIKDDKVNLATLATVAPISIVGSNIPALGDATGLQIVASTADITRKIQTIEDIGEYLGLYSGAPSSLVLVCILPIAGGIVDVNIPIGTRLSIKHLKASVISSDTYFSANLIG